MQSVPPEAAGLQRQPGRHTRRTDRGRQAKRTHRGDCSSLCPQLETQTEFSLHTRRRRSMERQQGRWGGGRHSVAHCPADSHPRVLSAAPASQRQTDGGGGSVGTGAHSTVLSENRGLAEEWASPGPRAKDTASSLPLYQSSPVSTGGPPWPPRSLPRPRDSVCVSPVTLSPRTGWPPRPSTYPVTETPRACPQPT